MHMCMCVCVCASTVYNSVCVFGYLKAMVAVLSEYITSGVDDQINVIVAWHCCSMSQRTSLVYLTDIEITKVSL